MMNKVPAPSDIFLPMNVSRIPFQFDENEDGKTVIDFPIESHTFPANKYLYLSLHAHF